MHRLDAARGCRRVGEPLASPATSASRVERYGPGSRSGSVTTLPLGVAGLHGRARRSTGRCRGTRCCWLSGDHTGRVVEARAARGADLAARPCRPAARTCSAYSPDASEKYAIGLPSGDHAGAARAPPVVLVRLRGSPFSAGTVTISPRNSNAARAPDGDRSTIARSSGPSRSAAAVRPDRRRRRCFRRVLCLDLQVEQVQVARLLVDDAIAGRDGGVQHGEVVVLRQLRDRLRLRVVRDTG